MYMSESRCDAQALRLITFIGGMHKSVFSLGCCGGAAPPYCTVYPPISVSEAAAPSLIRMRACMQSQSVVNSNYHQTVIQMQVLSNGMQYNCFK